MRGTLNLKSQNRSAPTAMSKGIVIYAFNSKFDYVKSAAYASKQAKKYLDLPVTLITNKKVKNKAFDQVIIINDNSNAIRQYRTVDDTIIDVDWFNGSRTTAYQYSPYDQTLLIDADYFMFNNSLKVMFDTNVEFACFDKINDITGGERDVVRLSDISIPMQWATVIYFTKCPLAQGIFTFMEKIKQDWEYYSHLYNFSSPTFRNDFALSIALQALTGYSTKNLNCLPGKLHTIFSNTDIVKVENNKVVCFKHQLTYVINTNVHCMNKLALDKFYNA